MITIRISNLKAILAGHTLARDPFINFFE
ncbi:hypothetical protein CBM2586_B10696 [Cupriavidus phytorum]|uniref:Uncharacterized protein n=1 Tax=Cupriavidus taiwanensis TaxID=164546 RepID=A0A975XCW5_9BURK|nr:hypothetical protein CBM2586_B10696 [Cupriavidus taiwanensis]